MRFLTVLAVAVAAMFLHATPAWAADACDRFPEKLSGRDIRFYENTLRRIVPLRHADLAHRFDIVNVPREGNLGPIIVEAPGGRFNVEVPEGYLPMLCRLGLLHDKFRTRSGVIVAAFKSEINDCYQRELYRESTDCVYETLRRTMSRATAEKLIQHPGDEVLRLMVEGAMVFALLHDFAHAAEDHFDTADGTHETQADAFAVVQSMLGDSRRASVLGALASQEILAALDDLVKPDDAHGTFTCRAESMKAVTFALAPRILSFLHWPGTGGTAYLTRQPTPVFFRAQYDKLFAPTRSARDLHRLGCRPADKRYLGALTKDFDAISATLDAIATEEQGVTLPFDFYYPLIDLPLATFEGRSVRASLIAARLRLLEDGMVHSARGIMARGLDKVVGMELTRPGLEEIVSQDYGALLASRAFTRIALFEGHDFNSPEIAQSHADFQRALYYRPGDPHIYVNLTLIEVGRNDCQKAFAWLREGMDLADGENIAVLRTTQRKLETAIAKRGCRNILHEVGEWHRAYLMEVSPQP